MGSYLSFPDWIRVWDSHHRQGDRSYWIGKEINPHHFSNILGLSFISIGTFAMVAALKEHRRMVRRIEREHYTDESSNTVEAVGLALILVGSVSFIGLSIRSLSL